MSNFSIRHYILTANAVLAGILLFSTYQVSPPPITRLTQIFGLLAVTYVYLALLPGALFSTFPNLPYRALIFKSRRAVGVSAFLFAILHSSTAFFLSFGGFAGLPFLPNQYLLAFSFGAGALLILFFMASTSFDFIVFRMGKKWKYLHRLIYLASVFILIHMLMIGSHFAKLNSTIPQLFFFFFTMLLILELKRVDTFLTNRFPAIPHFSVVTLLGTSTVIAFYLLATVDSSTMNLSLHNTHTGKSAQQKDALHAQMPPSIMGDQTKRYRVDMQNENRIYPQQQTRFTFKIYDAANGQIISYLRNNYEKTMHIIIVNDSLTYFSHEHPIQEGDTFVFTTQFPAKGWYMMYLDFQPYESVEQQFAFQIPVDTNQSTPFTNIKAGITENQPQNIDGYTVSLVKNEPFESKKLSAGIQSITFRIENALSKEGITTLQPYLGAFGHLVLINEEDYSFIHAHPFPYKIVQPQERGGPLVEFFPMTLTSPIKPGTYRLFGEFRPDGKKIDVSYTIQIQ